MSGSTKGFFDDEYLLYCDNGVWKTGYEGLGVDISGVCHADGNYHYGYPETTNAI